MPEHEQSSIDKQLSVQPDGKPMDDAATLRLPPATQQAKNAYQRGNWTEAERLCRLMLIDKPDQFEALNLLGIIAAQMQQPQRAIELLLQAVAVNPNHAVTHSNLGNVLCDLQRHEEALESFDRALELNSDDADTYYRRSGMLGALKRYAEALESCDNALKIRPDYAEALNNRGNALGCLNRPAEALQSFARALQIEPDYADALNNRGVVLNSLRRRKDALASYEEAIRLRPDHVDTHMNLFICLMQLGDFARGWEEYEWRWQLAKNRDSRIALSAPAWEGQKLHGSLLVWNEQGLGDEIFYAGMLNDLAPYAQAITVCVDHRLVRLFQRSFGNMQVISRQTLAPDAHFDAHIPMGSLGRYLRRSFSAFPDRSMPYLHACSNRARNLRASIAQDKRLLCGLSWISKSAATGTDKSLRLQDLAPVLTVPGIDFVDLQYGDTAQEQAALHAAKGLTLRRVTEIDNFNDIDGLAALIEACDVIVTISNTTAHLAAALGKPVLLMLPFSQGLLWYWHLERADNPWYPNVTSFRQPVMGDWQSVIKKVSTELVQRRMDHCGISKVQGNG